MGARVAMLPAALLLVLTGCATSTAPNRHAIASSSAVAPVSPQSGGGGNIVQTAPLIVGFQGQLATPAPTNTMSRDPRIVTAATDPLVTVTLNDQTQSPETIGYDVFVANQGPPASLSSNSVDGPTQWPGTVWDLQSANSSSHPAVVVPAGGQVTEAIAWPDATTAGQAVPDGDYWVVVWGTVNGAAFDSDWYWPIILQ